MLAKPAVEAQFTINGADGAVQGSALMAGAAFAFTTPQLDVWFDGRTQWVFLHSTGEVSITEPTADELATTNPFVVLSAYDTHYTSAASPTVAGAGVSSSFHATPTAAFDPSLSLPIPPEIGRRQ